MGLKAWWKYRIEAACGMHGLGRMDRGNGNMEVLFGPGALAGKIAGCKPPKQAINIEMLKK